MHDSAYFVWNSIWTVFELQLVFEFCFDQPVFAEIARLQTMFMLKMQ